MEGDITRVSQIFTKYKYYVCEKKRASSDVWVNFIVLADVQNDLLPCNSIQILTVIFSKLVPMIKFTFS